MEMKEATGFCCWGYIGRIKQNYENVTQFLLIYKSWQRETPTGSLMKSCTTFIKPSLFYFFHIRKNDEKYMNFRKLHFKFSYYSSDCFVFLLFSISNFLHLIRKLTSVLKYTKNDYPKVFPQIRVKVNFKRY